VIDDSTTLDFLVAELGQATEIAVDFEVRVQGGSGEGDWMSERERERERASPMQGL